MTNKEKEQTIEDFYNNLMESYEPLDPFVMQLVNENFWGLIDTVDSLGMTTKHRLNH